VNAKLEAQVKLIDGKKAIFTCAIERRDNYKVITSFFISSQKLR